MKIVTNTPNISVAFNVKYFLCSHSPVCGLAGMLMLQATGWIQVYSICFSIWDQQLPRACLSDGRGGNTRGVSRNIWCFGLWTWHMTTVDQIPLFKASHMLKPKISVVVKYSLPTINHDRREKRNNCEHIVKCTTAFNKFQHSFIISEK